MSTVANKILIDNLKSRTLKNKVYKSLVVALSVVTILPIVLIIYELVVKGIKQISWVLTNQGHFTEVACLDPPDAKWLNTFPFKVHALGPGSTNYKYSRKFITWLKKNIKNYDCVIVHGLWQYSSFAVWKVIRKTNIPYFIYPHGMLDPWFKENYALKHIKKYFYWPWQYRILRDAKAVL